MVLHPSKGHPNGVRIPLGLHDYVDAYETFPQEDSWGDSTDGDIEPLQSSLATWAAEHSITHAALNDLLKLLAVHGPFNCEPVVLGLFCGSTKPTSLNEYFEDFVNEILTLETGFDFEGLSLKLKLSSVIPIVLKDILNEAIYHNFLSVFFPHF